MTTATALMNPLTDHSNGNGNGAGTALAVYNRISDPMAYVVQMGSAIAKSGMFGCNNDQQGQVLAMACICKGIDPIDFANTYHIIGGKLSMRADAMLAKFRSKGGKHKWLRDGEDGQIATLQLSIEGEEVTSSFAIEEAVRAELVKAGGNWVKNPGSMLRARAISKGVRMLRPEIIAGCYSPEELEHEDFEPRTATRTRSRAAIHPAISQATVAAVAIDHALIDADANVVDAEIVTEPAAYNPADDIPFDVPAIDASTDVGPGADDVADNAIAIAAELAGESRENPLDQNQSVKGPATAMQVEQLRSLVADLSVQDPALSDRIRASLKARGMTQLADLSWEDAEGMKNALYIKAQQLHIDQTLNSRKTPEPS